MRLRAALTVSAVFVWQSMSPADAAALAAEPGPRTAAALPVAEPSAAAIYDPGSGQSPLHLLQVPADGVQYHRKWKRAQSLFQEKKWQEAEPLLESLVRDYSRDAQTWFWLGEAKRHLNKYAEAAHAYTRGADLMGWATIISAWGYPTNIGYRAAAMYIAAGDKPKGLQLLRKVIFEDKGWYRQDLIGSPLFASVKDDPEFLEIIGQPDTSGLSRNEGWAGDLDYLYRETQQINGVYGGKPLPAELIRRYEDLRRSIPTLSDEEIVFGMQRILAPLKQGHTSVSAGKASGTVTRYLPLRFYAFPEGIFIIDAADQHKHLIGSRVVRLGSLDAEEALRQLSESLSIDGPMEYVWAASKLAETYNLRGMGAIASSDAVELKLVSTKGRQVTVAVPTTLDASKVPQDVLAPPPGVSTPLFLSNLEEVHWEKSLPEHDALYVQVNRVLDDKDESLEQFGRRLWSVIEETSPTNLILDLRHSDGGVVEWSSELFKTPLAFDRRPGSRLFVLIGRRSYSATAAVITHLEMYANPIFVGEASSDCCVIHAPARTLTLPYSKVEARIPTHVWPASSPVDARPEMAPHVPVQLTAAAYFRGEDPVLHSVARLIQEAPPDTVD